MEDSINTLKIVSIKDITEKTILIKRRKKKLDGSYWRSRERNWSIENELSECKKKVEAHSGDTELLNRLYQDGFIDINGNPIDRST